MAGTRSTGRVRSRTKPCRSSLGTLLSTLSGAEHQLQPRRERDAERGAGIGFPGLQEHLEPTQRLVARDGEWEVGARCGNRQENDGGGQDQQVSAIATRNVRSRQAEQQDAQRRGAARVGQIDLERLAERGIRAAGEARGMAAAPWPSRSVVGPARGGVADRCERKGVDVERRWRSGCRNRSRSWRGPPRRCPSWERTSSRRPGRTAGDTGVRSRPVPRARARRHRRDRRPAGRCRAWSCRSAAAGRTRSPPGRSSRRSPGRRRTRWHARPRHQTAR
jgi:hypothetical protein